MNGKPEFDELQAHKVFAGNLYNRAWELIDKGLGRTGAENDEMLLASYASAYHWHMLEGHVDEKRWKDSKPIAHDQLARVHAELADYLSALNHAQKALDWCDKFNLSGFTRSLAHERLAFAYHHLGEPENRDKHMKLAHDVAESITDEKDKTYVLGELAKASSW